MFIYDGFAKFNDILKEFSNHHLSFCSCQRQQISAYLLCLREIFLE
ncbi:CLUMA_CG010619, isoform A [Clunio marinus]|uniref:CLUMA_CG010619, isoform A n=1 Tax=Clunio marinus TaxID=568069 RepID=A0A1J1IDZ3_9DIPT|nr:CLUMA_CG010619, isoform A [Clunio marinus]